MDVHYSTVYFKRLTDKAIYPAIDNPQCIRTDMDVRGSKQNRDLRNANLAGKNVQGCIFFTVYQKRHECTAVEDWFKWSHCLNYFAIFIYSA